MTNKIISIFFKIVTFVCKLSPLRNYIIFESNPDFADNTNEVYLKMLDMGMNKKYKFVWLLNKDITHNNLPDNVIEIKRKNCSVLEDIRYIYYTTCAKYIIDCNVYVKKVRDNQIRIHLKHGLPIKDATAYTYKIGDIDLLSVPSKRWIEVCAKEHNVSKELVKAFGFPRNDVLIPKLHDKKTIIWMPTYRFIADNDDRNKSINDSLEFGLPCINSASDLEKLNDILIELDAILFVRFHPAQDVRRIRFETLSNIKLCNDEYLKNRGIKLYEFLCETDALISDYSSIYYDYLKLKKPIALSISDFDEYASKNGLICKTIDEFKDAYPAIYLNDFEDLNNFIIDVINEKEELTTPLEKAEEIYDMCYIDNSTEMIVNNLIDSFNL